MRNNVDNFKGFQVPLVILQNYLPSAYNDLRDNIILGEVLKRYSGDSNSFITKFLAYSDEAAVYLNGVRKEVNKDYEVSVDTSYLVVKFIEPVEDSDLVQCDYIRK